MRLVQVGSAGYVNPETVSAVEWSSRQGRPVVWLTCGRWVYVDAVEGLTGEEQVAGVVARLTAPPPPQPLLEPLPDPVVPDIRESPRRRRRRR